ncbi:MAG: hypothetical protein ACFE91_03490 [Promethearchaeota archaeon]
MTSKAVIGLDYSHNNILTIESSSFGEFTQFLFSSGYKLGKIEAGFYSLDNLKKYNIIILSTPKNINLNPKEIEILESYVKNGGSLLIISSSGGDYSNNTNLNELTRKFGFEFELDEIFDSVNYVNLQKRPILTKFKPHVITEQIKKIVFSSSCSIKILDFIEDEKNVKIDWIVKSGLNSWHKYYNGEQWIEEDSPKIPLMVVVDYYKGRVIGFGNLSIFSSLAREYGFSALDNDILIANILSFLIGSLDSEGKAITVELNLDLYHWAEGIVNKEKWENISDFINVGLKYFKDNYNEIIKEIKKLKSERLEKRKEYEKAKKEEIKKEVNDDKILEKLPVVEPKKEDLVDIMSALEEITGEKYELSIELDEEKSEEPDDKPLLDYNDDEILEFEEKFPKKAIWQGKETKAFKRWLKEKNKE